jgi:hypothetical protein
MIFYFNLAIDGILKIGGSISNRRYKIQDTRNIRYNNETRIKKHSKSTDLSIVVLLHFFIFS